MGRAWLVVLTLALVSGCVGQTPDTCPGVLRSLGQGDPQFTLVMDADYDTFPCVTFMFELGNRMSVLDDFLRMIDIRRGSTILQIECTFPNCQARITDLFTSLEQGTLNMPIRIIRGIRPDGTTVENGAPAPFPLWAIGAIVGGTVFLAMLILILCCCCCCKGGSRKGGERKRRKRRKRKNPKPEPSEDKGYFPLAEDSTLGASLLDGSEADSTVTEMTAVVAEDPDEELEFELLFSVKPTDKEDILVASRGDQVSILRSDWENRTEWVWGTVPGKGSGWLPSTHAKRVTK